MLTHLELHIIVALTVSMSIISMHIPYTFALIAANVFLSNIVYQMILYSPETYTAYTDAVYPHPDIEKGFSEDIAKLSPNFIKIYHQAEKAENMGLSEICGLGYRKALEFLIKDYGILFHPDDEEKIKNMALSPCINTYIDNPRIKTLATASAWIGNDETHYVRKHEDYNLEHLKIFISATVSFINSELSYLKAEQLLNTPK